MRTVIAWVGQIITAGILIWAAIPKLSSQDSAKEMFDQLGMEPFGRFLIGIIELLAASLLLVPFTAAYGALLAIGVMIGAMIAHVTEIGVTGQHGLFFILAWAVLGAALLVLFARRRQIPMIKDMFSTEGGAKEEEDAERP